MSREQNDRVGFAERVRRNQQVLRTALKPEYDFIVCGSGSSGSVVARRLAEEGEASVLLLEAGGEDDLPAVLEADQWPVNLGRGRDWNFQAEPSQQVNGRPVPPSEGFGRRVQHQRNGLGSWTPKRLGFLRLR